jgi:hypothetical protein
MSHLDDGQVLVVDAERLAGQDDLPPVLVAALFRPLGLLSPELPIGRTQDAIGGSAEFSHSLGADQMKLVLAEIYG